MHEPLRAVQSREDIAFPPLEEEGMEGRGRHVFPAFRAGKALPPSTRPGYGQDLKE